MGGKKTINPISGACRQPINFSKEQIEAFREVASYGVPTDTIAQMMGVSPSHMRKFLSRSHGDIPIRQKRINEIVSAVEDLEMLGWNRDTLCRLFQVHRSLLREKLGRVKDKKIVYYKLKKDNEEIEIEGIPAMKEWCQNNYYLYHSFKLAADGKLKTAYGYKVERQEIV